MPADPARVKELFVAALDLPDAAARTAFLARECAGDTELRRRLDALLAAHDHPDSAMDRPFASADGLRTAAYVAPAESVGAVIAGRYKLLQQIGEGGFGVVFMAEQQEPVRRMVALKIIKPGMDTAQVIARFESERQALALMDHPNIAKVLDAGATESGRPFFVMELVKGVPITEFCDKNHMPPGDRLKLFINVCHAIHHAHHKGVIHRDVKPSNVMVTLHDGVPVAKIIDFGVAKATAQKLTEKTLFTAYGQMVGTPAYMSPEQAEMSGLDIDTRSDVYSLGVLLYELLTGTTPLESKRLREAGYAEMQRLIREEEPPRPSTRLSSLGDSATVLAGNRGLDVRRLVHLLSGDLDWIVMKSLEKDRNRRYVTPGNLADDIERYLRREAIAARPPSTSYRLRKFVQRNRGGVLTAGAIMLALLLGAAVAVWQAVRATQAKQRAIAAADAEGKAKVYAETRAAEMRAVLEFVESKILAAARPDGLEGGLGYDVSLRKAIEAAVPYVGESFPEQPLVEARLRLALGMSFIYLGDGKKAIEQNDRARELIVKHSGRDHPDALQAIAALGWSYDLLGRYSEALQLNEAALGGRQAVLGPDHVDTLKSMEAVAWCYGRLNRHEEALRLNEQVVALRLEKLGPDHADTIMNWMTIANSCRSLQRYERAIELYEKTVREMKEKHPEKKREIVGATNMLANGYESVARHDEALRLREYTTATEKVLLGPDHPGTLGSMYNLASSYAAVGRHEDALKLRQETLALRKVRLGVNHPDTLWAMWAVASSLIKLKRGAEAIPVIDETFRRSVEQSNKTGVHWRLLELRLGIFRNEKDAARCRRTSETWDQLEETNWQGFYRSARMWAITAGLRDPKSAIAAEELDRAMSRLRSCVDAGFDNAPRLKADGDLAALRPRDDFKKLVADLESRAADGKKRP